VKAHGQWVKGVDFLDQRWQLHRLRMGKPLLGNLVPRVGGVKHAVEAEFDVFGGQFAGRAEILGAMKFHLRCSLKT
jgi:hypothetical protein